MKSWRRGIRGIICGIVGGFIGVGLIMGFGPTEAILIIAVVLLTAVLYDLDQYYLEKGPQKYLKALDKGTGQAEKRGE